MMTSIDIWAWVIPGLAIASVYFFLYESVIRPSLQTHLKYRLYEARDAIRAEECRIDQEVFEILQAQLNAFIANVDQISILQILQVRREWSQNDQLLVEIRRIIELVESAAASNAVVKSTRQQLRRAGATAVALNSGGWLPYIFPLIIAVATWGRLKRWAQLLIASKWVVPGVRPLPFSNV